MKPIEAILHHKNIMGVVEKVKDGVPDGILDPTFFRPTKQIIGNEGTYFKVESTRQVARAVNYGSPSVKAKTKGISKQSVTLIHAYENFDHNPNTVALLLSEDNQEQQLGAKNVARRVQQLLQRSINLRRAAWYIAMANGKIWLDGDGNLLASASGAVVTIDFGVPAGNKGQCDWDGKGAIIGASWATGSTDVVGHMMKFQKAGLALTGYAPRTVYYGANIPGYVAKNTSMKEYLKTASGGAMAKIVASGMIPDGFAGFNWRPAYLASYEDKDGTTQWHWGDDTIVVTPAANDPGWFAFLEGSYSIPTDVGVMHSDAMAALRSLKKVFGMFSYADVIKDPVTVRQYAGDTFLPIITVPKSIFIADVIP